MVPPFLLRFFFGACTACTRWRDFPRLGVARQRHSRRTVEAAGRGPQNRGFGEWRHCTTARLRPERCGGVPRTTELAL
jgi:hypothetical protein